MCVHDMCVYNMRVHDMVVHGMTVNDMLVNGLFVNAMVVPGMVFCMIVVIYSPIAMPICMAGRTSGAALKGRWRDRKTRRQGCSSGMQMFHSWLHTATS
jgi:hypothetical protein